MSLRLTDFGTYDEVNRVFYFTFTISKFSGLKENKISRAFRHAGHIWKLQVRKVNGNLGLFLRWYSTKIGLTSHIRCFCKTGIQFTVINHFDNSKTLTEGSLLEDDIYDRPGSGVGYGEVIELRYLENIPGFLISNTLVVQLRLKVKSTTFIDKLQVTSRPDRIFVRGLNFSFHGSEWCMVLFPNGEEENSSEEEDKGDEDGNAENKKSTERDKSTLYLSRESGNSKNPALRHNVQFSLFVVGGPCFTIVQNFHEKQSSVFGTGYLMSSKALQKLGSSGVIRVGVTFLDVTPYFNFGYDLNDDNFDGINFTDQRDLPWLLKISDPGDESECLSCSIKLDPQSKSKRIKALTTREKQIKTIWHLKIINFKDFDMNVDIKSEQSIHDDDGVFRAPGEQHSVLLPLRKHQMQNRDSPYLDDDGQACVQISILDANFVSIFEGVGMKIDEVAEIAHYHKDETIEVKKEYDIRERIWKMSISNLEKEKNNILNSSQEELEKQENELRQKDLIIHSLEEKLHSVEGYVESLESNSLEDIDKFHKTSISKRMKAAKPDESIVKEIDDLFDVIENDLKSSTNDVSLVVPSGSYGAGTLTNSKLELDVVVFFTGELEDSMKNGNLNSCLEFIQNVLQSSKTIHSKEKSFSDFVKTPISVKCKYGVISIDIYPTKNWIKNGYHVIYEASTGLTPESLICFITATSERRSSFIHNQDEQCKDLIRLLKAWIEEVEWTVPRNRPSSYLLSLLTIHAFEIIKSTEMYNTPSFCKEVLTEVGIMSNDKDLRIEWDDFYDVDGYEIDRTKTPLVRDPVLPSHNVADSGIGDWWQFRREISIWLASLCP